MEKNIFNRNYEFVNEIHRVIKMGGKLNLMAGIKTTYLLRKFIQGNTVNQEGEEVEVSKQIKDQ